MEKICGTCAHWRKIRDENYQTKNPEIIWPGPHGECNLFDEYTDSMNAWIGVSIGDGCKDMSLITMPDFGCNHWYPNYWRIDMKKKCEYKGCNKDRVCFHYCEEHHKIICMLSIPKPIAPKPQEIHKGY